MGSIGLATIGKALLIVAFVMLVYDYYQVRTQALCAHAKLTNSGSHR